MDSPSTPTEHLSDFQPSFCPWRACAEHRRRRPGYRFRRHGYYSTRRRRRIPRFRCLSCTARRRILRRSYANPRRGPKGSPRSEQALERDQAMSPVDLLHKILRHSLAHNRRETIAFARRLNAAMERMALTAVWRNFVKRRSERRRTATTPAVMLELTDARWSWKRVLSRRLFYDRTELPPPWPILYRRLWKTPLAMGNATHNLVRAF